jgi:hypothetical protein
MRSPETECQTNEVIILDDDDEGDNDVDVEETSR